MKGTLMDDQLTKRIRAAAGAGWWTILILAAWMTVGYAIWILILPAEPEWIRCLWGGRNLTWDQIHVVYLWFYGVVKMVLLVFLTVTIWLTIWGRKLRKAG